MNDLSQFLYMTTTSPHFQKIKLRQEVSCLASEVQGKQGSRGAGPPSLKDWACPQATLAFSFTSKSERYFIFQTRKLRICEVFWFWFCFSL